MLQLSLCKDEKLQLRGKTAFTLPPSKSKGNSAIGMTRSGGPKGVEAYVVTNPEPWPDLPNRITLQMYRKLVVWHPNELFNMVNVNPAIKKMDTIRWVKTLSRLLG